ncbi:sensor histidine kinase [Teichococcus oryzae]|uniref:histidine kinase n=1 Tax=Teichococcus oryzae TaxID=1608942 RepID=A0A5B2TIY3_9PROT|nr:sensor histidine kinase [Pseudoroseomonas oryzae]KAA2213955.1 sensor histidine kinase [Pseudoroseomonas oryzae]
MLLLLLVASVPVVGIAGANAVLSYEAELAAGRRTAAILSDVSAARHGTTIETLRQTLTGLGRSEMLLDGTPARCEALLRSVVVLYPERYRDFWVLDREGRVRCGARLSGPLDHDPAPPGYGRGESLAHEPYFQTALHERKFTLTPFRRGASTPPVVIGAVPILQGEEVAGVVAGSLLLDAFVRREAAVAQERAQRVWLLDRDAVALPLTPAGAIELPPPEILRNIAQPDSPRSLEARAQNGAQYAYGNSELAPGLRLLVGLPTGDIRSAANTVLLRRALELAAFLLACLVVIVVGADLAIARPLRILAARVRQWRPGAPFGARPLRGEPDEVRALEQAVTEAAAAIGAREAELRATLRQRDLLMAEIHHRVKNNLQIVASLLNLQAGRLRDPAARAEFATARDRVQALATLHRHLYTNQTFEVIALRPFLEELGQQLFAALGERPGQRIRLVVEADELEIVTDQAVSLALLITETVTNAIKHGFPDARSGTVTISVHAAPGAEEGEEVTLTVRDDGLGLRLDDEEAGQGIGLTLIRGFAQHLGGEMEIHRDSGTEMVVRFPLRRREADPALLAAEA